MVFSSLLFLFVFLPLCLICYYITPWLRVRNLVLVAFSIVFYAWGEPIWVTLLLGSAFVDYWNGRWIERYRGRRRAVLGVVSTLVFNLGCVLLVFKYSDLVIHTVNSLAGTHFPAPGFVLPIGISFYTFLTISYTLDVYRGEVEAQPSFLNFLVYIANFHHLVAGPIIRYGHIAKEIEHRVFRLTDFSSGVSRFCRGLFKKVFLANVAGELAAEFLNKDLATLSVAGGWFGLLMFTLQIYFDFSGYSDMAIGLGRMFGFHYHENFAHPYMAKSITDFWRRWHISLGSFFRDYVYIPLGGNRSRAVRNILLVWALTGIWHGASWNFMVWGLYFGLILLLEKYVLRALLERLPSALRHLYAKALIVFGWSLFYFTDFGKLLDFHRVLFALSGNPLSDYEVTSAVFGNILWILLAMALCMPVYAWVRGFLDRRLRPAPVAALELAANAAFFALSVSLLVSRSYNPFIYFRF